jgi:hypothetical protein
MVKFSIVGAGLIFIFGGLLVIGLKNYSKDQDESGIRNGE